MTILQEAGILQCPSFYTWIARLDEEILCVNKESEITLCSCADQIISVGPTEWLFSCTCSAIRRGYF
jgi:hypothetical protein